MKRSRWLLLPYNPGWHWVLLACEIRTGNVYYYDSYHSNRNYVVVVKRVLSMLRHVLDRDDGESLIPSNTPQQHYGGGPGVDCGIFCCGFGHMLACEGNIEYIKQELMDRYRLYIGCCIHTHTIL